MLEGLVACTALPIDRNAFTELILLDCELTTTSCLFHFFALFFGQWDSLAVRTQFEPLLRSNKCEAKLSQYGAKVLANLCSMDRG
jgi:hypothetical protein